MKYPTFSIVTPSYNQAQFIEETITSILDQAGDFKMEYIVADAGSKDGSVEIIKRYAAMVESGTYPLHCRGITMQWWSKKDKGQSDAINKGLKLATGDFVAYLNSDDTYLPGALEGARKAFAELPDAGGVYSDFIEVDEHGNELNYHKIPDFDLDYEIDGNIIPQPTMFMRRPAQQQVGYFNEAYHYAMDYDMWVRLGKKYPIYHRSEVWATFRLHGDSKTVSQARKFWKEEREISRSNGGRFFSRMYVHTMYTRHPKLTGIFIRASRLRKHLMGLDK